MAIPFNYNRRSLLVRRVSNAMTAGAIALVIAVFVIAMALVNGMDEAMRDTSAPDNLIALRQGAVYEASSTVTLDQLQALQYLPGIQRGPDGLPLASPELAEQIFMRGNGGLGIDSLPIRGVLPIALKVHEKVHIVAGRMFTPGLNEVVIGKLIEGRYPGASLGSEMKFGRRSWKVVGVLAADGSSFESEVWGDLHSLEQDARRGSTFNSVRIKMAPGTDPAGLIRTLADDPKLSLTAKTEDDYYQDQAVFAHNLRILGLFVAFIMAFSAIFAAMNTMYSAVAARTTEIGTLRALGFSRGEIMASFLSESAALALVAGLIGILLALPMNGYTSKFNGPFSTPTLAFNFHITWAIALQAIVFASLMGLVGGWLPARHAMRITVVNTLRRV